MCITRLLNKRHLLKYLLLSLSISKSKKQELIANEKTSLNSFAYKNSEKLDLLITKSIHVHKEKYSPDY